MKKVTTTYTQLVGQVLRYHRKKKDMDQARVSKSLGMTASGWSRLERGETSIDVGQLRTAARALGTTSGEILRQADSLAEKIEADGIKVLSQKPKKAEIPVGALVIGGAALVGLVAAAMANSVDGTEEE